MKKLLKVSIFLIISALFFAACDNGSSNSGGDEELPGNWTTTTAFKSSFEAPFAGATLTGTKNKFVYTLNKPQDLPDDKKPDSGNYKFMLVKVSDENFTGFKATASCSSSNSAYGFLFNGSIDSEGNWSYYTLQIQGEYFNVDERIKGGDLTDVISWTKDTAINPEPDENEVVVYTDEDGSIIIQINGSTVGTLRDPKLHMGFCGVSCNVSDKDVANKTPITSTYVFDEFQH